MSDTNRIRLAWLVESTYGTTPSSSSLSEVALTGESLSQDTQTQNSARIRRDRMIDDVVRANIGVSGDINFELTASNFDTFMQYALQSAGWSSPVVLATESSTISFATSDNSINDSGNGFGSAVVGQWIRITGASNAANNGLAKVVSKTAGKIVCSNITFVLESAGDGDVSITMGAQIVNGVSLSSIHAERKYEDLTNIFARYAGLCFEGMSLAVNSEAMITGSFSLMGKSETSAAASFGSGYTAPSNKSVMNAVDHVKKVTVGGTVTGVTALSFALANNLRGRTQVASLGPVSVGSGTCDVSGTAQLYFATQTLMDKYLNFESTTLSLCIDDGTNAFVFEFPNIRFTSGKRVAGGVNQDIIADLAWTAFRNSSEDIQIRIARW